MFVPKAKTVAPCAARSDTAWTGRFVELPVRYLGVGEGLEDLVDFEPDAFAEALLDPA